MDKSKQHWVPSSYLEVWCDPGHPPKYTPYVWRFPKDGGGGQCKAPQKIFAEVDFYTIHLPDGQRDLSLEHGLGKLEEKFCQIRRARIDNREPLNTEEKVWFCGFVAAMHFRTRAQRNAFRQQWGHAVGVAEDAQQALDAMTPEQLQQYRPPRCVGETRGPSLTINDVKKLADQPIQSMLPTIIEEDLRVLARMNLVIFTTEDDIGFITSDHPCVWFDPNRGRRPPMLESRTIEVFMPVSPNSLALLCWEELPNYKEMSLREVDNANRFQQMACDEYFVVRRNATKPVWFT
jgi:hypothetical protein